VNIRLGRLFLAIGVSLALIALTGCASGQRQTVTYGAPLTHAEAIKRKVAPPQYGCQPTNSWPTFPNGGCV